MAVHVTRAAYGTPEKFGSGQLIQPERTIVKGRGSAEDDPEETFSRVRSSKAGSRPAKRVLAQRVTSFMPCFV